MLSFLISLFKRTTPQEAYDNGQRTCDDMLAEAMAEGRAPEDVVAHIQAMASGEFNTTVNHRAFDRGVLDRLSVLGYDHDSY